MPTADLVVVGAGPAGRALAAAAVTASLDVVVVDPDPDRAWTSTYAAFAHELAPEVPRTATMARPGVATRRGGTSWLADPYVVIDTARLQHSLRLDGVRLVRGRARTLSPTGVDVPGHGTVTGRVVVDARGALTTGRTVQTAYGVVLGRYEAEPLLARGDGLFMDWRPHHGADPGGPPTFCYVVPLDDERVLVEETSLAARPGLATAELRARLRHRLAHHGIAEAPDRPEERVRFALAVPLGRAQWAGRAPAVPRIGAAAPVVHPATGYSVAASLRLGPLLAAALADGADAVDLHGLIWPRSALATHALRLRGLRVLTSFGADETDRFFAAFFTLAPHHQRAYLCGRDHPGATMRAMAALLPRLDPDLRRTVPTRAMTRGWVSR
ncbi:MAG: lycopene cyclase [Nocardioides sp.]|nr:lycopene cyclase [Nocardioides sp.]